MYSFLVRIHLVLFVCVLISISVVSNVGGDLVIESIGIRTENKIERAAAIQARVELAASLVKGSSVMH